MHNIAYKEMFENEMDHPWYEATRKLLIKTLEKNIKKDAKILDAGCGTGGTILYLQKAGYKNIYGVDNSQQALKYCRIRKIKNLKKGSVNNLPFGKNTFDCVICLDVLYHQGVEPKAAIVEFKRILKSGGILYSEEPAYNWLKSKHDIVIQTDRRFTRKKVDELLKSANFKIQKLTYFNSLFFVPILIKRIKDKFMKDKVEKSDVQSVARPLAQIYRQLLAMEIKSLEFSSLPFGLSIISVAKKP